MKILHDNMKAFEQAVARNKWFALACLTLVLAFSLGFGAELGKSNRGTGCYMDAERALFGSRKAKMYVHEIPVERIVTAKTHYSVCLLANGIDVRSVPVFEELFPFTSEAIRQVDTGESALFESVE
ncbi:MAG: hypothetical protein RI911_56 [Candidatus Parcubacteria bacterium]|jgi:hypothetical protein